MILWLASYPKSGNTWTRILISQLISKNNNKLNFYEEAKKIDNYPEPKYFNKLVKDTSNREEIIKNWLYSQNILCLKNETQIFKTHNILGSFGEFAFTNAEVTAGVIYIVRDPRNIISSVQNHFSLNNIFDAKNFILDKNKWIGGKKRVDTFISSWNYHYLSWKSFKKNYHLIKYEDLVKNTKEEVIKLIVYLKKFFEVNVKENEIDKIIKNASFESLQNLENEGEFDENTKNKITGKKNKFFRLGPSNDWKKYLDKEICKELESKFEKEMKELGYL